jgi:hypothetical protein
MKMKKFEKKTPGQTIPSVDYLSSCAATVLDSAATPDVNETASINKLPRDS